MAGAKRSDVEDVSRILDRVYHDGFTNGIAEGLAVAERIYVWYAANDELAEPKTREALKIWSQRELQRLKGKLL